MRPTHALPLAALLLLGCSSVSHSADASPPGSTDAGSATDAGPPPPPGPPLDECVVGWAFADCGGDRPPAFACSDSEYTCRWFTGGVVAEGYRASSCSADDLCCVSGPEGSSWPFADQFLARETITVASYLYAFGLHPWDAAREVNLVVDVDPALEPEGAPRFSVDGEAYYFGGPMRGQRHASAARRFHDAPVVLVYESALAGTFDAVELIPAAGGLRARICRVPFSDGVQSDCAANTTTDPVCASEGEVRISAAPESAEQLDAMRITYWARFPDGTETELAL